MSIVLFQIPQNYQNSGPMGGSAVMVNMGGNQQVGMTSGMFYRYRRFFPFVNVLIAIAFQTVFFLTI